MSTCDPWTEKQMVSIIESERFNRAAGARNRALFALQCSTGARVSEVLGLTRSDVIDDLGRIKKRISFTNTKNGETRHVDLINPFAVPFLRVWLKEIEALGYLTKKSPVFPGLPGRAITRDWWRKIIQRTCNDLKFEGNFGTHSCRKTWARDTYKYYHKRAMSGELVDPLLKLQEAGGWKTIDAARRYIAFMLGDTSASQESLYPELQNYVEKMGI